MHGVTFQNALLGRAWPQASRFSIFLARLERAILYSRRRDESSRRGVVRLEFGEVEELKPLLSVSLSIHWFGGVGFLVFGLTSFRKYITSER